jgi:hypothetical protein
MHSLKWISFAFPVKLEYNYTQKDTSNFYGITFNTVESKIKAMKWLGGGPIMSGKIV